MLNRRVHVPGIESRIAYGCHLEVRWKRQVQLTPFKTYPKTSKRMSIHDSLLYVDGTRSRCNQMLGLRDLLSTGHLLKRVYEPLYLAKTIWAWTCQTGVSYHFWAVRILADLIKSIPVQWGAFKDSKKEDTRGLSRTTNPSLFSSPCE